MTNGCLCCAVKSNAVMAIEKLMEKSGKFDYVLIETTGKILSLSSAVLNYISCYLDSLKLKLRDKNPINRDHLILTEHSSLTSTVQV